MANADFKNIPIHSIDVHLDYHQGNTQKVDDFHLSSESDVGKFATYIENNQWKYKDRYQVNYKGFDRVFKSPDIETDNKSLTINVGDSGYLAIDVQPGDLNFDQVEGAQVTLQYEDSSNNVPLIEESFTLDKDHREHKFAHLIFVPAKNPYKYRVKYFMTDGKEFAVDWQQGRASQLYINDPFSATKTIGVRAIGDLQSDIGTIFVDLKYVDAANNYTKTKSVALSKANPFFDWSFPVIDENTGKISYSGSIQFQDGKLQDMKETETTRSTIMVGKARDEDEFLQVQVIPDLLDFTQIKLAKLGLHYVDEGNGVDVRNDLIVKKDGPVPPWVVRLQDKTKKSYQWEATFFMADGTTRHAGPATTSEKTLVPRSASIRKEDHILYLTPPILVIEGVTVFPDHEDSLQYYCLPMMPRLTTIKDPVTGENVPQIQVLKYRGTAGNGGFLNFDCNIGLDQDKRDEIAEEIKHTMRLRETPHLGDVPFIDGSVRMLLFGAESAEPAPAGHTGTTGGSGTPPIISSTAVTTSPTGNAAGPKFVTKIDHSAKPALYGNNQAAFSVALDQSGVTVLEQALKGEMSPIGIVYALDYLALRPAYNVSVNVDWDPGTETPG